MRAEAIHIPVHSKEEVVRILTEACEITKELGGTDVSNDAMFSEASRLLSVRASVVQSVPESYPGIPNLGRTAGGAF